MRAMFPKIEFPSCEPRNARHVLGTIIDGFQSKAAKKNSNQTPPRMICIEKYYPAGK